MHRAECDRIRPGSVAGRGLHARRPADRTLQPRDVRDSGLLLVILPLNIVHQFVNQAGLIGNIARIKVSAEIDSEILVVETFQTGIVALRLVMNPILRAHVVRGRHHQIGQFQSYVIARLRADPRQQAEQNILHPATLVRRDNRHRGRRGKIPAYFNQVYDKFMTPPGDPRSNIDAL